MALIITEGENIIVVKVIKLTRVDNNLSFRCVDFGILAILLWKPHQVESLSVQAMRALVGESKTWDWIRSTRKWLYMLNQGWIRAKESKF